VASEYIRKYIQVISKHLLFKISMLKSSFSITESESSFTQLLNCLF